MNSDFLSDPPDLVRPRVDVSVAQQVRHGVLLAAHPHRIRHLLHQQPAVQPHVSTQLRVGPQCF